MGKKVLEYKNIIITAVVTALVVCGLSCVCCTKTKIATVDVNAIVSESAQVLALKNEQQAKVAEIQAWLEAAKADVENQSDEKVKASVLARYNAEFANKRKAISTEYSNKLLNIDKNITAIVEKEAKRMGYTIVLAKSIVVYGATDITSEIKAKVK